MTADGRGVPGKATANIFVEMRHVAEEIGGSLTLETSPDSETTLRWSVPLPE
jgi:signal transduction histidine kinase